MSRRKVALEMLRIMQREAPGMFSDYEVVRLDDGTEVARTPYEKCRGRGSTAGPAVLDRRRSLAFGLEPSFCTQGNAAGGQR